MSWTTPRTWVHNEVNTASQFNAHIKDNENVLKTIRGEDGRITELSSSTVASLVGTSLTGLSFLASSNTHTAGTTRFLDASRVRVPVGTDKWTGTKGVDAAGIWVEGDYLHHIAQDLTTEYRYLGTALGSPGGALTGSVWVEGNDLHYIDASGVERYCIFAGSTAQHSDGFALEGSAWIETYTHWIKEGGTLEMPGHADVSHSDHIDHTDSNTHNDHTDHNDTGSHNDNTTHSDTTTHGDQTTHVDSSPFPSHLDHDDASVHQDVNSGLGTIHTDHDDHGDHSDHTDSGAHGDNTSHNDNTVHNDNTATQHSDVAADNRPVVV